MKSEKSLIYFKEKHPTYQPISYMKISKFDLEKLEKDIIPIIEKLKKRTHWENKNICLKRKNLHEAAQLKNSCIYE